MTDERKIMAHLQEQNYGDHGAFVLTTFKLNGDVDTIYRPIAYARIWIYAGVLKFETADGVQMDVLSEQVQAVLNAIGERKQCNFYYGEGS